MIRPLGGVLLLSLVATVWAAAPKFDPGPRWRSEESLRDNLWGIGEPVDLGGGKVVRALLQEGRGVAADLEVQSKGVVAGPFRPHDWALRRLVAKRPDLRGLPLVPDRDAKLSSAEQQSLFTVSDLHRRAQQTVRGASGPYHLGIDPARAIRSLQSLLHDVATNRTLEFPVELTPEAHKATPARLEQVFQVYPEEVRSHLIEGLKQIKGPEAERALARRAVFDLSPFVRDAAVKSLALAKRDLVRPVFLSALRHPWPAAADHAARALVELKDRDALPALRKVADLPPPDEPFRDDEGTWHKRSVARIDHLRNCLLCHPAANHVARLSDVAGVVQIPGQRLATEEDAKQGQAFGHIVFLRPDLSAIHDRSDDAWPRLRRFDYVAYVRPLSDEERKSHLVRRAEPRPKTYPQREAVLWAIRQLVR